MLPSQRACSVLRSPSARAWQRSWILQCPGSAVFPSAVLSSQAVRCLVRPLWSERSRVAVAWVKSALSAARISSSRTTDQPVYIPVPQIEFSEGVHFHDSRFLSPTFWSGFRPTCSSRATLRRWIDLTICWLLVRSRKVVEAHQ